MMAARQMDALSLEERFKETSDPDDYLNLGRCDPAVPLRFALGTHVVCSVAEGWMRGVITATHFTEEHFNEDWPKGTVAAYQVRLNDGLMIYAQVDCAACIRPPTCRLSVGIGIFQVHTACS